MKRSDYRIIKYLWDCNRQDYFQYEVQQRFLWFFWVTPDDDNILAHWVLYSCENNRRAKTFSSKEEAEKAIFKSIAWRKASAVEIIG